MEFWADKEALARKQICSHIAKTNEFDPGVRCYVADDADDSYTWGLIAAMGFGVMYTLGILALMGRL